MKTEYIVALIMVVGGIIVALINGLFTILSKRLDSATLEQKELPPAKPKTRSKLIWAYLIAVIMVGLSLWLFYAMRPEASLATREVSAKAGWQSSGVYVFEGNTVEVVSLNEWSPRAISGGNVIWTDADGIGSNSYFLEIGLNAPLGTLIAEIGDGPPFVVGKNAKFDADRNGTLFFRINDTNLDDNFGSITIQIKVKP